MLDDAETEVAGGEEGAAVAEIESMPKDSSRREALKVEVDDADTEGDDETANAAPTTHTCKLR